MTHNLISKIFFLLIFLALVFCTNCQKESEGNYIPSPKAKIYKTTGNYFNLVNTWGAENGPSFLDLNDQRISIIDNDTLFSWRWKLVNDYVLCLEIDKNDYFTNITYAELVAYNESHSEFLPIDSFLERVTYRNPFLEFYIDENDIFSKSDSLGIQKVNQIIKDGELVKYFKKIK